MRLAYIAEVDFRSSELHNFTRIKDAPKLGPNDVVLLISLSRTQLCFVHGFTDLDENRRVLRSERLRLTSGTWNPLMLVDYAERVGLKLEGLKRFNEYYKKLTEG